MEKKAKKEIIAGGKESKEGATNSFLHTVNPFGTMLKKHSTTTCRGTWPGHKKRDCSLGRQGLTPLLFKFSAGRLRRKSGIHQRRQNFTSETLHVSASSEDSSGSSSSNRSSKTHEEAAGNRLRSKLKATQQLRRKTMNLKLIEFEGFHKLQCEE